MRALQKYDRCHKESIENWEEVFDDLRKGNEIKVLFIPNCEKE